MLHDMAVEEPVADGVRRPPHGHGRAAGHELGDDGPTRAFSKNRIADRVAASEDLVVEAVQMQGVSAPGGIDEPPLHGITHRLRQTLGVRPRETVEDEYLLTTLDWSAEGGVISTPHPHDEDAIARGRGCAGRVDDDRTAELTVSELSEREGVPRSTR